MNRTLSAVCALILATSVAKADESVFRSITPGMKLEFPRDHGAHPAYSTEWWYVTGHLKGESGRSYGFELVFFRVGVNPEQHSRSAWAADSVYLSHFALTDDAERRFYHSERRSRGSFAEAGAAKERLKVWNKDWNAELIDERMTLRGSTERVVLELSLRPKKPIVLHGENGLSVKGPGEGEASYYSSFTRLLGEGELTIDGQKERIIAASAWFDHEFTSSNLSRGTKGWDWFAIQLDSGEELMVYQLREDGGSKSPFSSGTFVPAEGVPQTIRADDFTLEVLERWTSPTSGAVYPARWRLRVKSLDLNLLVTPTVADQELQTDESTGVTYWEGRSLVVGTHGGNRSTGAAYVELVGYTRP